MNNLIDRINTINYYISIKGTGTPKEFAYKLNISERMIYEYLNLFKRIGAPIKYCKIKKTYYYEIDGILEVKFNIK